MADVSTFPSGTDAYGLKLGLRGEVRIGPYGGRGRGVGVEREGREIVYADVWGSGRWGGEAGGWGLLPKTDHHSKHIFSAEGKLGRNSWRFCNFFFKK